MTVRVKQDELLSSSPYDNAPLNAGSVFLQDPVEVIGIRKDWMNIRVQGVGGATWEGWLKSEKLEHLADQVELPVDGPNERIESLEKNLKMLLGKSIAEICPNKFHALDKNHCAHFVSHILGFEFPFNCKQYRGGSAKGGNVRVSEIFEQCPKVGRWRDADKTNPQLVIVAHPRIVNMQTRQIPSSKRHIGIYVNGKIYHYSNTPDEVRADSPTAFREKFKRAYGQPVELFFGLIPGLDLVLNVKPGGITVPVSKSKENQKVSFRLFKTGPRIYEAQAEGDAQPFVVGKRVTYTGRVGLMSVGDVIGHEFRAIDYHEKLGHWANLIELTGHCESRNRFGLINSYDRAAFTFGFFQFAAHTGHDNLMRLLHLLADLPNAEKYIPEIRKINGRLHRVDENGSETDLEILRKVGNEYHFVNLKRLLNVVPGEVDRQEWLYGARLIHWAANDRLARDAQVEAAYEKVYHRLTKDYDKKYGLDGRSDTVCALVVDIRHQGRASSDRIRKALKSRNPVKALIEINPRYKGRIRDLEYIVAKLQDEGRLGIKVYSAHEAEFV